MSNHFNKSNIQKKIHENKQTAQKNFLNNKKS